MARRRPDCVTLTFTEYAARNDLALGAADDLPLFSGTPARVTVHDFSPKETAPQPALFDLRPTFGEPIRR